MASYSVMTSIIAICLAIISFAWIKIYQVVRHQQVQIQDQMAAAVATQSCNMARFRNSAINILLVLVIVVLRYTPFLVSKIFLTVNLKRSNVVFLEICQPRSQGLSSNRPLRRARRDPGLVWSRTTLTIENIREGSSVVWQFVALSFVALRPTLTIAFGLTELRIVYIQAFI